MNVWIVTGILDVTVPVQSTALITSVIRVQVTVIPVHMAVMVTIASSPVLRIALVPVINKMVCVTSVSLAIMVSTARRTVL